ncbi:uncharacterized protein LOC123989268 [Osmia bicornis bicornis]|uniref:uncharacterized protein LOC123989268 n=1 Tax=Osmia bicornis bicornis TaxID=1437191 RepID=UPI001EAF211B|nr:uncharacterized protein LOC123989268 [Osmia bicornis bicornis]
MEEGVSGPSGESPTKKNPLGKFVGSSQRMMIVNLYENLMVDHPEMRYKPMIRMISRQTGIGQVTISKTLTEYKTTGSVRSPYKKRPRKNILEKTSDEDILAIRRKVHDFWLRREIPNVHKILQAVNLDPALPNFSRTSLYRLLKRMDFKYMVSARNNALIETENIIAWRQEYIEKIQQYRTEGRPIYYLDESWINARNVRKKLWVDTSVTCPANAKQRGLSTGIRPPANRGKRLIIGHVGSADGFVPGALLCFQSKKNCEDYHGEMNGAVFFEWFRTFLPMLRDGSVVVMDNAPYHSTKLEKFPTMGWKKNDIIEWLIRKGEIVQPEYVKARLLQLSYKYRRYEYVIDEYAKQHGHTVVRLPPYHCELNPIELAWAQIKNYIKTRNTTYKLDDVQRLLYEAVEDVTAESWQNFIRHTRGEENRFLEIDQITDNMLDQESGEWVEQSEDSDVDDET